MIERREFLAALASGVVAQGPESEGMSTEIREALLAGRPIVMEVGSVGGTKSDLHFAVRIRPARDDEDFSDWRPEHVIGPA